MTKKLFQFAAAACASLLLFWLLSIPLGPAPPLGPFLNPSSGFWANAQTDSFKNDVISLPDSLLSDSVHVYYDSNRIPHIFAQNNEDLYFAQGYVTARDRLWQMEFQTRAAAGRLSEVVGQQALQYDRYQRRIGMGYAAEQAQKAMLADSATAAAVKAYTTGINAWINQLSPADYPVEYKILNYAPGQWTILKTALLLKYMTYTLAGSNDDLRMSNTRAFFGDDFIKNVLDVDSDLNDPIIPSTKKWNFKPLSVQKPDSFFTPSIVDSVLPFQPNPRNGSNNWAVSGSKTASGYPILANDPHLNMTLPSIWYVAQLHSLDQNVMGATLPGAPTVIIGYNENAAWGTTNVSADVWDWYEMQFRDSTLSEYKYDGQWKPTQKRIEKIKIKGKKTFVDTVVYTQQGPVVQDFGSKPMRVGIPKYYAMHWIAYEPSNELKYFLKINKATDYEDYHNALRFYESPAQNWVFADKKDIAITVTGKYPLKWENQGRFIGDGSDPRYSWQKWIPFGQIPSTKNPDRGFLSSANQDPTDHSYPYYLDDDFAPFERGRRINDRLAAMTNITPKDMQKLQMDVYSYHAKTALPILLRHLRADTLSDAAKKAYQELKNWNWENKRGSIAASVFDYWWDAFYESLWSDEYGSTDITMKWPARDQTVQLIKNDSTLKWIDDINTPEKETLDDLVNRSFEAAIEKLQKKFGAYSNNWQWGTVDETNIRHIARLPGFGREQIFTDGAVGSIDATSGSHGPSWRMVVQLGPQVKAWGIYPGGQSGDPSSTYYDNMINDWANGHLRPLWFMREEPAAAQDSVAYSIKLK